MTDDQFQIHDSCSADTLQIADQIFLDSQHIEVHSVNDLGSHISITGYSYEEDDEISIDDIDPDTRIDLWLIA
jgi:hypothetical protein